MRVNVAGASMPDLTKRATDAIGDPAAADWELSPHTHAEKLNEDGAPLRHILASPEIQSIVETFNTEDARAVAAQKRYKKLAKRAAIAGFMAVFVGCILILPSERLPGFDVLQWAGILQFALLSLSIGCSLSIAWLKPFECWMQARGRAEQARANLFRSVLAATAPSATAPGEVPLIALQLEYFRRYQLDVQREYYGKRGPQHRKAARISSRWRLFAFVLIVFAAVPVLYSLQKIEWLPWIDRIQLPESNQALQRAFLGLGVMASALQGLLAAIGLMNLDERNAARYGSVAQNLEFLHDTYLGVARQRAIEGDRSGVLKFTSLVQEQISSEHREWVELRMLGDVTLDTFAAQELPQRS